MAACRLADGLCSGYPAVMLPICPKAPPSRLCPRNPKTTHVSLMRRHHGHVQRLQMRRWQTLSLVEQAGLMTRCGSKAYRREAVAARRVERQRFWRRRNSDRARGVRRPGWHGRRGHHGPRRGRVQRDGGRHGRWRQLVGRLSTSGVQFGPTSTDRRAPTHRLGAQRRLLRRVLGAAGRWRWLAGSRRDEVGRSGRPPRRGHGRLTEGRRRARSLHLRKRPRVHGTESWIDGWITHRRLWRRGKRRRRHMDDAGGHGSNQRRNDHCFWRSAGGEGGAVSGWHQQVRRNRPHFRQNLAAGK